MTKTHGYSLIEVFIALLLVSLVFFALLSLYPAATSSMKRSRTQTNASNLAQEDLETVRGLGYDDPALAAGITTTGTNLDGTEFTMTREITDVHLPDLKQVKVTVTWDSGPGAGFASLSYTTCVFRFTNSP